jgi:hypothetical protein
MREELGERESQREQRGGWGSASPAFDGRSGVSPLHHGSGNPTPCIPWPSRDPRRWRGRLALEKRSIAVPPRCQPLLPHGAVAACVSPLNHRFGSALESHARRSFMNAEAVSRRRAPRGRDARASLLAAPSLPATHRPTRPLSVSLPVRRSHAIPSIPPLHPSQQFVKSRRTSW